MTELLDMIRKRLSLRIDALAPISSRMSGSARCAVARPRARRAARSSRRRRSPCDATRDQATTVQRATPRVTRLAQVGGRARRAPALAAARRGRAPATPGLRDEDHRDLARRTAALRGRAARRHREARPARVVPARSDRRDLGRASSRTLQDEVPPVDAAAIRARIEAELGRPIAELFATFDDAPIAAAILAQVHAATLHDGTRVVVKVQVPGIEDVIAADIAALRAVAGALGEIPGIDLQTLSSELARALAEELDYAAEAARCARTAAPACVPRPIADRDHAARADDDADRRRAAHHVARAARRGSSRARSLARRAGRRDRRADPRARPGPRRSAPRQLPRHARDGRARAARLRLHARRCRASERAAYARLVIAIAGNNHAGAPRPSSRRSASGRRSGPARRSDGRADRRDAPGREHRRHRLAGGVRRRSSRRPSELGGLVIPRSFVLLGRVLASVAGLLATLQAASGAASAHRAPPRGCDFLTADVHGAATRRARARTRRRHRMRSARAPSCARPPRTPAPRRSRAALAWSTASGSARLANITTCPDGNATPRWNHVGPPLPLARTEPAGQRLAPQREVAREQVRRRVRHPRGSAGRRRGIDATAARGDEHASLRATSMARARPRTRASGPRLPRDAERLEVASQRAKGASSHAMAAAVATAYATPTAPSRRRSRSRFGN